MSVVHRNGLADCRTADDGSLILCLEEISRAPTVASSGWGRLPVQQPRNRRQKAPPVLVQEQPRSRGDETEALHTTRYPGYRAPSGLRG